MTRPQVFLSYTWADEVAIDLIERALLARKVAVFRDRDIRTFDGITDRLEQALDSSVVLLAFYSLRYPTRYACQWELTRAFLAASRLGNPWDRVLIVNPEPDTERQIAPVDLSNAAYFSWRRDSDAERLADAVMAKVALTGGTPLGGLPSIGVSGKLLAPKRFVGRYPEMWAVHSALHGGRYWGVHPPEPHSVVVVKAPSGMGKTELAKQYGFLFKDAYPGGLIWTGLAGEGRPAREVLTYFAAEVNRIGRQRFNVDLSGLSPEQATTALAELITEDTLWVIDDVPNGLDHISLNTFVLPSARVHTVLTMRTAPAGWPVRQVPVGGLSVVEGEELFRTQWPELDRTERQAIARLVERHHGHPLVLSSAVASLRNAQGTGALEKFVERTESAESVIESIVVAVRDRGPHAKAVLGFAGQLAHAPVDGELLLEGLTDLLGAQASLLIAEALDELDRHTLLHRTDHYTGGDRQSWQLHALVEQAVRRVLDQVFLDDLARRAARVLLDRLTSPDVSLDVHRHALELAGHSGVPMVDRLALARAAAVAHEDRGDLPAARDARYLVMNLAGAEASAEDALAEIRLAVTAGDIATAVDRANALIERDRDPHTDYRARFLAAAAHDLAGDYPRANAVFHDREPGIPPWLPPAERQQIGLARVRALRLRGKYRMALRELEGLLPEINQVHPLGAPHGAWPLATVELARLRLLSGEVTIARQLADKVIEVFASAGLTRHQLAREAVAVRAEAELTVALKDRGDRSTEWLQAAKKVRRVLNESTEWFGPDNPLTLDLMVLYGQTLHQSSERHEALGVLADAERRIGDALGTEHPLALRARLWAGLATMGNRRWEAAASTFETLLPRSVAVLGRNHPESQLTRYHLGICLAKLNDLKRAQPLIAESAKALNAEHTPWQLWSSMANVANLLVNMPPWMWRFFNRLAD